MIYELPRGRAHPRERIVGNRLDNLKELTGGVFRLCRSLLAERTRTRRAGKQGEREPHYKVARHKDWAEHGSLTPFESRTRLFGLVFQHSDTSPASSPIPMNPQ